MNTHVGHRIVEFGSEECENCGNEQLKHLHLILMDDGRKIEVGCVCAAKLCDGQQTQIDDAEKRMDKEHRALVKRQKHSEWVDGLRTSWKKTKRRPKKGSWTGNEIWVGMFGDREIILYWRLGKGWTPEDVKDAPHHPDIADAQRWIENYLLGVKV